MGMDALWIALGVFAAGLLLLGLAAWLGWRAMTAAQRQLARRVGRLGIGDKFRLAYGLFRDRRLGFAPRLLAAGLVLYLAMPFDIIPDFVPVLGYLDDLLIVVLAGGLILRSIPAPVLEEHLGRYEAKRRAGQESLAGRKT